MERMPMCPTTLAACNWVVSHCRARSRVSEQATLAFCWSGRHCWGSAGCANREAMPSCTSGGCGQAML